MGLGVGWGHLFCIITFSSERNVEPVAVSCFGLKSTVTFLQALNELPVFLFLFFKYT